MKVDDEDLAVAYVDERDFPARNEHSNGFIESMVYLLSFTIR